MVDLKAEEVYWWESFALHVASLSNDMSNALAGHLRTIAADMRLGYGSDIENLATKLESLADDLIKKKKRLTADCREFVGGDARWYLVDKLDFESLYSIQANNWKIKEPK